MKHAPLVLLAGLALSAGCYHATITTGLSPSPQKIDVEWANSFLWGLVPPAAVDATTKCKSGVAEVDTQMSFLNMVANAITGGIYSPMQITVTCAEGHAAAGSNADVVQNHHNPQAAIEEAARRSARTRQPVYIQLY